MVTAALVPFLSSTSVNAKAMQESLPAKPNTMLGPRRFQETHFQSKRNINTITDKQTWIPSLFLITLIIPFIIYVGSARLSIYRIFILILFLPCFLAWLRNDLGGRLLPDYMLFIYSLWATISISLIHGFENSIEPSGILIAETMGPYLIARKYIRSRSNFYSAVNTLSICVITMIPFAMFESLTATPILLDIFQNFISVYPNVTMQPRLGFDRAQVVFEHPILFGVFCASAFSLTYYTLKNKFRAILVALATFFSLSAGALISLTLQIGLILWDICTKKIKNRWNIFAFLTIISYIFVDLLSNRSPVQVFISYLTFNVGNAYNRVLIWRYGTASVAEHPIFGIGFNEWDRAFWMSTSMDNFWLVIMVRHGLPAFALFAGAALLILIRLGRLQINDPNVACCRTGLLISIAGLSISACTCHFWNATYCLFIFLLGSGMWILEGKASAKAVKPTVKIRPKFRISDQTLEQYCKQK